MPNPLMTAVSGLLAHQRQLEIVGNNIANMNTAGYKSARGVFEDLLYETVRPATSGSSGNTGGTNPNQIGTGAKIGQIDRKFTQGNLESTGEEFDFALVGDGFFVVSNGSSEYFTRVGAFSLDDEGTLVDASTGYRVVRFGSEGEPDGVNPGFQTPGDSSIRIPIGTTVAGQETTSVGIVGNLSSDMTEARTEVLLSSAPFQSSGAAATSATLLNDVDSNTIDYIAGDVIEISGVDADGTWVETSFVVGPGTTLGDLVNEVNSNFSGATASLDANGNLRFEANDSGSVPLSLTFADGSANTGFTNFGRHALQVLVEGKEADTYSTSVDIYDVQGRQHRVNVTFEKQNSDTWSMVASVDPSEGSVTDDTVQQIIFSDEGELQGASESVLSFQFDGIAAAQNVVFEFTNAEGGLTHYATDTSLSRNQDGFAPGTLTGVKVGSDGKIEGVASNGRIFPVAQLAIASFRNERGLKAIGESYYEPTLNSGEPEVGVGNSGDRGQVLGSHLESSNVDIAAEFTKLIVAQRGFSANARTITVTDEVLEELTNVIR